MYYSSSLFAYWGSILFSCTSLYRIKSNKYGGHSRLPPSQLSMERLEMPKYSENAFWVMPEAVRSSLIVSMNKTP